ncbi:hypothetical protein HKCCE3408_08710 [Rhodobacterales bacterium HKCCE3408]|nr:hypothetical protein [Rhodobacterales bacterium HKCCE3408]
MRAIRHIRRLIDRQDGTMTVFGLFMFMVCCGIGGIALDLGNAIRLRTHLQIAADSAAHAALVARVTDNATEAEAILEGIAVAARTLPGTTVTDIIRPEDFQFGIWDEATRTFTPVDGEDDAVLVDANRIAARGNAIRTYLLRFLGPNDLDLRRVSVVATFIPTCFREGFVAESYVDMTSNSFYERGFCVHSNGHVAFNNNSVFQDGAIVSMPDRRDVVLPSAGMTSNEGLADALRDGYYTIDVEARINNMVAALADPTSELYPSFLTSNIPVTVSHNQALDLDTWQEGRIHQITCNSSNQSVRIPNNLVLRNGVILTNCEVSIGETSALEDAWIITTSTSVDSVGGAANIRFGLNDDCEPGGGVQVMTLGGVRTPNGLALFGSRIAAVGPVKFTSDVGGLDGVSIISETSIDGTAGGHVGFCGEDGLPNLYDPEFFRIVL